MNALKIKHSRVLDRRDSEQADRREIELSAKFGSTLPLAAYVKQAIELYFVQMKDHDVVDLYATVITEIERPLLETTLRQCGYNQTKAAKALGLSRSTLRKKLEQHGLES